MKISKNAKKIIETLNNANFEAYVVGGCVRDSLMGKVPKDFDITTSAKPEEVIPLFKKVFETGIQHGTVTVVLDSENFEVTTYRLDGEYKDNRRPEQVFFTSNLEEDLTRRDFTINAIAYHPENGYFDPYGGTKDIENKLIKGVGNADTRFKEDALRMMRAIRFSSQLGFSIEENTLNALSQNVGLIEHISIERTRDEFLKAMLGDYLDNALMFNKYEIFKYVNLELYNYLQKYFEKKIKIIKRCKKDVNLRLVSLFHEMENEQLEKLLVFLRLDNKSIKYITTLSKYLNKIISPDFYNLRKVASKIGHDWFLDVLYLKEIFEEDTAIHKEILEKIIQSNDPLTLKDLKIDGNILMKENICAGREIGNTLNFLLDMVHQNPENNTAERLLQLAKKFVETQ